MAPLSASLLFLLSGCALSQEGAPSSPTVARAAPGDPHAGLEALRAEVEDERAQLQASRERVEAARAQVEELRASLAAGEQGEGAGQDEALRRAERLRRDEVPRLEEASRRLSEQAAALEELARQLEERTRGEVQGLLGRDLVDRYRVLGGLDP